MGPLPSLLREHPRLARRAEVLTPKARRGWVLHLALPSATSPKLEARQQAVQAKASPRLQLAKVKPLVPMLE